MDVEKPQRSLREFQSNSLEEEEEDIMQQNRKQERAVMTKLTAPCLSELEDALQVKRYLHYHTIQFSPVVPVVQSYTRKHHEFAAVCIVTSAQHGSSNDNEKQMMIFTGIALVLW